MKNVSDELPPLGGHGGHWGIGGHGGTRGHGGLSSRGGRGDGAFGGQLHCIVLSLLTVAELAEARCLQALHSVHLRLGLAGA